MKSRRIIATAILGLFSGIVVAGSVIDFPVEVALNPDGSGSAAGNMTTARFSDNDVEYIGCGTRNVDLGADGIFQFGFCQAGNAAADEAFCSTENPDLVAALRSISAYSFVSFSFNDLGECTRIGLSTQSFYIPAGKVK
jgi:hypothetical protein